MKVLVIEDDREAAAYLVKGLGESGYVVDHAPDGREGLFLATSASYDALIVDRMLPGMDGLSVIGALRLAEVRTPALILSALGAVDDRVKGLRAGGDDYLVKPFAFSELLARLEALLRRGGTPTANTKLKVEPSSRWKTSRWTCWRARCGGAARSWSCCRGNSACSNI
jgi:two-component system OmpR family response regulator